MLRPLILGNPTCKNDISHGAQARRPLDCLEAESTRNGGTWDSVIGVTRCVLEEYYWREHRTDVTLEQITSGTDSMSIT